MAVPPDVKVVRIKTCAQVGAGTGFHESFNIYAFRNPAAVRVVGYFRNHTRTRVTPTKIRVCYTNGFDRNALIAPAIKNSSGSFRKDWIPMIIRLDSEVISEK
ncbi:hypothetical protein ACSDR0_46160 [Streptosporangium sp. G11]|uniref:hypothetical protein n=1 Tax=Streptosporangium sp. G11 TaxID=3436926 RepID=UPI003EBAE131